MASIKYVNEGEIKTPCLCWRLFRKLCAEWPELNHYNMLVGKGIDDLSIEEDLFVVAFEFSSVKSLYNRLRDGFLSRDGVCSCGRKYCLPNFETVCRFQINLSGRCYSEIT